MNRPLESKAALASAGNGGIVACMAVPEAGFVMGVSLKIDGGFKRPITARSVSYPA